MVPAIIQKFYSPPLPLARERISSARTTYSVLHRRKWHWPNADHGRQWPFGMVFGGL